MDSSQRETVDTLFLEVLEHPPQDRAAVLREECDDPAVRAAVEALLEDYEASADLFDDFAQAVLLPALRDLETGTDRVPSEAPDDPLDLTGSTVGRYEVQAHIGGGGMGVVYRAQDPHLDRRVALKFLPPYLAASPETEERFVQEAQTAARTDHPNIATIHEIGTAADGRRYIAMAYYEGETLEEKLERKESVSVDTAVRYAEAIAEALAQTHEAGIVHRDVKPGNVMVTAEGEVKLLDFGLAQAAAEARLPHSGRQLGTPSYMSPEQVDGATAAPEMDLWAVGVLLHELLTGHRPFQGETPSEILRSVLHEEPVPVQTQRPDVPQVLDTIIDRCLQKSPADRYASAGALADDLRALSVEQTAIPERTIAVLPFSALGQEDLEAFTRGMHESLLTRLSNISDLEVTAGTSVERYRDTDLGLPAIADSLGVQWVVEGSVWKTDDRIQVTAHLIDPWTGERAWGSEYRRDLTAENLFDVHGQITQDIAEALTAQITLAEEEQIHRSPTENLRAYRLYVKGRSNFNRRTETTLREGIRYMEQALQEDASYALAWAGLADALLLLDVYAPNADDGPDIAPEDAARRALDLDPDLAEAHASLGQILHIPEGTRHLRRAVELKPSDAQAHQWLAVHLLTTGQVQEARKHASLAAKLSPELRPARGVLIFADVAEGKFRNSLARIDQIVHTKKDEPGVTIETGARFRFASLMGLDRWDDARELAQQARSQATRPAWTAGWTARLGLVDVATGHTARAERRREELKDANAPLLFRGHLYTALGETSTAASAYEAVDDWGHCDVMELRYFYPDVFTDVRSTDRFAALIQEIPTRVSRPMAAS
jgi:serine/threonine protein kinase/tetratricopeptide (TPR) repeat protein